ncbi:hypothetical protein LC612_35820 [Nostoc sp. CHAB 5834]|nr:hypothetical protein [Nostoc sp. CHAB 5834]
MNRFDICEAHAVLEWDFNVGGWLRERPTNLRRMAATSVQLHRMGFKPAPNLSYENLSDEGREVYLTNVLRWGLPIDDGLLKDIGEFFSPDWLAANYPEVATRVHQQTK